MDISGSWKGFYEQGGARHGIAMQVAQCGQSFVGRMADEATLLMSQLSAADHELLQRVMEEPLAVPPDLITSLPEHSTVEGEVEGEVVRFLKRYLGKQQTQLWLGDRQLSIEIEGHRVRYEGTLDRAGNLLRGRWSIPSPDEDDAPEQGAFELRRQ